MMITMRGSNPRVAADPELPMDIWQINDIESIQIRRHVEMIDMISVNSEFGAHREGFFSQLDQFLLAHLAKRVGKNNVFLSWIFQHEYRDDLATFWSGSGADYFTLIA